MKRSIYIAFATATGSLALKLCHNVAHDYVVNSKEKGNDSLALDGLEYIVEGINVASRFLDLGIKGKFITELF